MGSSDYRKKAVKKDKKSTPQAIPQINIENSQLSNDDQQTLLEIKSKYIKVIHDHLALHDELLKKTRNDGLTKAQGEAYRALVSNSQALGAYIEKARQYGFWGGENDLDDAVEGKLPEQLALLEAQTLRSTLVIEAIRIAEEQSKPDVHPS